MTITAKFPATCHRCRGRIEPGQQIDWVRGQSSTHADRAVCETFIREAQGRFAPAVTLDLEPIARFVRAARDRGLQWPKLHVLGPAPAGGTVTVSLAGDDSRNPGALYVKWDGEYLGLVTPLGQVRGRGLELRPEVQRLLVHVATDPVAAAQAYAKLTGHCSFCQRELTDAGSLEVGYGPICADRWGLPHAPAHAAVRFSPEN